MTDNDFLTAMGIQSRSGEDFRLLAGESPVADALIIDDHRSDYCEQLEKRVAFLTRKIEILHRLLRALFRS
jgi:hypothetical protein